MESGNHSKNGATLKSHTSRIKIKTILNYEKFNEAFNGDGRDYHGI